MSGSVSSVQTQSTQISKEVLALEPQAIQNPNSATSVVKAVRTDIEQRDMKGPTIGDHRPATQTSPLTQQDLDAIRESAGPTIANPKGIWGKLFMKDFVDREGNIDFRAILKSEDPSIPDTEIENLIKDSHIQGSVRFDVTTGKLDFHLSGNLGSQSVKIMAALKNQINAVAKDIDKDNPDIITLPPDSVNTPRDEEAKLLRQGGTIHYKQLSDGKTAKLVLPKGEDGTLDHEAKLSVLDKTGTVKSSTLTLSDDDKKALATDKADVWGKICEAAKNYLNLPNNPPSTFGFGSGLGPQESTVADSTAATEKPSEKQQTIHPLDAKIDEIISQAPTEELKTFQELREANQKNGVKFQEDYPHTTFLKENFDLLQVTGDGNCAYYAIAQILMWQKDSAGMLDFNGKEKGIPEGAAQRKLAQAIRETMHQMDDPKRTMVPEKVSDADREKGYFDAGDVDAIQRLAQATGKKVVIFLNVKTAKDEKITAIQVVGADGLEEYINPEEYVNDFKDAICLYFPEGQGHFMPMFPKPASILAASAQSTTKYAKILAQYKLQRQQNLPIGNQKSWTETQARGTTPVTATSISHHSMPTDKGSDIITKLSSILDGYNSFDKDRIIDVFSRYQLGLVVNFCANNKINLEVEGKSLKEVLDTAKGKITYSDSLDAEDKNQALANIAVLEAFEEVRLLQELDDAKEQKPDQLINKQDADIVQSLVPQIDTIKQQVLQNLETQVS